MNVIDIPGYLDAVLQERLVRDAALFRLRESINGLECLPLTLRHYLTLRIADSPMLPPFRVPTEEELSIFLWVISPDYDPDNRRTRHRFLKKCRGFMEPRIPFLSTNRSKIRWQQKADNHHAAFISTIKAAQEYMTEAFQDIPPRAERAIMATAYYSDILGVCADLCREFGWTLEYALDLPVKVTFQLIRETITTHNAAFGQPTVMGNQSDRIKSDWLRQRNDQLTKN